jgi:hypothetical protein
MAKSLVLVTDGVIDVRGPDQTTLRIGSAFGKFWPRLPLTHRESSRLFLHDVENVFAATVLFPMT